LSREEGRGGRKKVRGDRGGVRSQHRREGEGRGWSCHGGWCVCGTEGESELLGVDGVVS
jgi:hypothetical protein